MSEYTIAYMPPPYGEITPHGQCRHNPAGHLMSLGQHLAPRKRGGFDIVIPGRICMKCGAGDHVDAENWIDLWWIAKDELSGKCPQFALRLTELAEAAFGDFRAFMEASVAQWQERTAQKEAADV